VLEPSFDWKFVDPEHTKDSMISVFRRSLAFVSACALVAALIVYGVSFMGATMDAVFRWAMFLHVGVFALLLPMYAVEYSTIRKSRFVWDAIWRGIPKWGVRASRIVALIFAAHFVLFLVQSHAASPEIKDGQYVLNNHGQIVKELTEAQYRWLKGCELRLFATGWMSFYLVLTLYWWVPRRASTEMASA
jgi:hypothetical protein